MAEQINEYIFFDNKFRRLVNKNARVLKLYDQCLWAEGPVYFPNADMLVWSDIPNNRQLRWVPDVSGPGGQVSVFRQPANNSNGNTRDYQGRQVTCEHGARRVTRTEYDGSITVLADNYQGKRLNSPNDVVVKSDGTVWFTDPPYGHVSSYEGFRGESELGGNFVFRFDPKDNSLTIVEDSFTNPNGLAFSPDEKYLFIADTGRSFDPEGPQHVRKFAVSEDNKLSGGQVFCSTDVGATDGFRFDIFGNLWSSAGDGVHCFDPGGECLGKILVPEVVSNLAFGGPKRNRLFMTATTSLYAVYLLTDGLPTP